MSRAELDPEPILRALVQRGVDFSEEEIAEAFAATRGLTMPSQLRRMIREQGKDLHEEFLDLLPERPAPIPIQRWTVRRVGLLLAVLVAGLVTASLFVNLLGNPL